MFKKLKNFKIVEKAPYWLIAPVVILLVAAIVFTVFAVQSPWLERVGFLGDRLFFGKCIKLFPQQILYL